VPAKPEKFHIDKRADQIVATTVGDDDDLLDTRDTAKWLGVSEQWLEIRRHHGGGPKFVQLSPRQIKYRRKEVLAWLKRRSYASTAEYAE
jgi:predicted DNA-binding transcriptional regulator AlpA